MSARASAIVSPTLAELELAWAGLPLAALAPALVARAHARLLELWPLLERWVEINSFTSNFAGCDQVADELLRALALPGLDGRRVPGRAAADHLVWKSAAWGTRPGVLLVGHHDTVFPPGTFESFSCDAHKLYGPGVLDMKGGLALLRTAAAALADCGLLAELPVAVVSVSDEETGSADGRRVLAELTGDAAVGLVFEAGRVNDAIVTRRKGTGKLVVSARGRAAHAGNDLSAGRNAIWALARFIDGAQRLTAPDGRVTVNVGLVTGGTSAQAPRRRSSVKPAATTVEDGTMARPIDQRCRSLPPRPAPRRHSAWTYVLSAAARLGAQPRPVASAPGTVSSAAGSCAARWSRRSAASAAWGPPRADGSALTLRR